MVTTAGPTKNPQTLRSGGLEEALSNDLLSHGLSHTTIGAGAFHFRVRDGIGWYHTAVIAEQPVGVALLRGLSKGLGRNKEELSLEACCAIED